jgi:hypothetical protein
MEIKAFKDISMVNGEAAIREIVDQVIALVSEPSKGINDKIIEEIRN